MKLKKVAAFGLAVALAVGMVPNQAIRSVLAEIAGGPITISYPQMGGSQQAEIIRGTDIKVTASRAGQAIPGQNIVRITAPNAGTNPPDGRFNIISDTTDATKTVIITPQSAHLLDNTKKALPAEGTYNVDGNFITYQNSPSVVETTLGTAATLTLQDRNTLNWIPVSTLSQAKLSFGGGTQFTISNGTGTFTSWQRVNMIEHVNGTATVREKFVLDFIEERIGSSGDTTYQTYRFDFYPNYPSRVDSNGVTLYDMPAGAEFDLTFSYTSSNTLVLKVRDPREVLNEVASSAVSASVTRNEYVKLKNTGDGFDFITGNISLRKTANVLGEGIKLEWEWIPDDPNDPAAKDVIIRAEPSMEETLFQVYPLKEDTKGKLQVTATYSDTPSLNNDVENGYAADGTATPRGKVTMTLPITIHGKGVPGTVIRKSQIVGQNPEEAFADPALPSEIVTMDVYRNQVPGYGVTTTSPYQYNLDINLGSDNGLTKKLEVEVEGDKEAILVTLDGKEDQYVYENKLNSTGKISMSIAAKQSSKGDVIKMTFRFYVAGNGGTLREETTATKVFRLRVDDSSPRTNAQLKEWKIKTKGSPKDLVLDFGFSPDVYDYTGTPYKLPFTTESITFEPEPMRNEGARPITKMDVSYYDTLGGGWKQLVLDQNGVIQNPTDDITTDFWSLTTRDWEDTFGDPATTKSPSLNSASLYNKASIIQNIPTSVPVRVEITVRAEDPTETRTYKFQFEKDPPSTDSSLKTLQLLDEAGEDHMVSFDPETKIYKLSVPYHVSKILPKFETNVDGAQAILTSSMLAPGESQNLFSKLLSLFSTDKNVWIDLKDPLLTPDDDTTDLAIEVKSEYDIWVEANPPTDGLAAEDHSRKYEIDIKRNLPGRDATLTELKIFGADGTTEYPLSPVFYSDLEVDGYFEVTLPYIVDKVKLQATPTDKYASMVAMVASDKSETLIKLTGGKLSGNIAVDFMKAEDDYDTLTITVTAEDPTVTKEYPLRIYREAPSKDSSLKSLTITDQDAAAVAFPDFDPEVYSYTLEVPFEVRKVSLTPTPNDPNIREMKVNGRKVAVGSASKLIELEYDDFNSDTDISVEVWPQDPEGTSTVYTITFQRQAPSSDARLVKLELTNATDFKPVFAPSKTSYNAKVAEKAEGVIITPTANNAYAKITIDGKRVDSGKPSELIRILEVYQTVEIVVTAQDGVTTMTYKIRFRNENLIEKTDNADLIDLQVKPGEMRPEKFSPSVTSYEVTVAEDVHAVELLPVLSDDLAKMQVFAGTKEIGDDEGNFASAIQDGENSFVIKVTSPDGTKTKEYTVNVYRNEEDKMGSLKPITPDDIDFETSDEVIVVDITKYSRVSAEVFEELKKYPNKKIVFQGNDYSLTFDAADLKKVIPHTEIYDLGMSFTSPQEDEIMDIIDSYSGNGGVRIVMIYFKYHGELPAPAALTLSLGHKYGDEKLFWNYYNEERERIDYYGNFKTNSRGTFSVMIDHLSTYIVSDEKLRGAENKMQEDLDLSAEAETKKVNPNTGESGGTL